MSDRWVFALFALLLWLPAREGLAQARDTTGTLSDAQIEQLVRTQRAIDSVRDLAHKELAEPKNKKDQNQLEIRARLKAATELVLKTHSLSLGDYERYTFLVATDSTLRRRYDQMSERVKP